jgi:hypothetical protein
MSRLQQVACRQRGYAIITCKVLVDESGDPVYWMDPSMEKIEPINNSKDFLSQLLDLA